MSSTASLSAFEPAGASDGFIQEVGQIDGTVFTAEHSVWDTAARYLAALVRRRVFVQAHAGSGVALAQVTVEGLNSVDPDWQSAS